SATLTVLTNSAPTGRITAPTNGTSYRGGQAFTFTGTGTDPEDGNLPPSAFTWRVDFHHDTHVHPFVPDTTGSTSGSFTIPQTGETAANVFYRIHLTVRDGGGLTHSTFSDVVPRKANITLASSPAGLQVTLDGQPVTTPTTVQGVVGVFRTIGAVSPQTSGATTYTFQSWSDGGAAAHQVTTPSVDTTYTATYVVGTVPVGIGLAGYYYDNIDFTGAIVTRLDPNVNFTWGTGSPVTGIGPDTFSVRWTGQVRAKVSGVTTFYTTSDDGVRLFVNNVLIVDNWTDHAPTDNTGTITLTAGQKYDIRMDMYENGGGAVARLGWSGPGLAREFVPQTHLFPFALLVAGSTTLNAGDAAIRDRLTATGFTPVVRTGSGVTTAEAAGKGLVLLSSTPSSSTVNTKFRTVVTPVLNWESALMDDLGMTGTASGTDFGTTTGQTQVAIVNAAHPLAAGLSGTVNVTSSGAILSWGVPNANAVTVARPVGQAGRAAIFAYEKGAAMPGLAAPGRRVGFFLEDATAASLTTQGRALLDAAVRWVTGR
ncbi:MAG TPA: PA14 domain-containing protein, partial [Vicinamibacteria bacterium]|nr:PA14 domain-containing protein [Vicinamibacteria bacterium]